MPVDKLKDKIYEKNQWRKKLDPELDPDPDPLVRDTDPGIRIRIRTKNVTDPQHW